MKVLIGCEFSGNVRRAFRERGHNAWSCDILPAEDSSPYHIQANVLSVLEDFSWDMAIFHPPCTYLCSSGLHWNKRVHGRQVLTDMALDFVRDLMRCGIPKWALENPIGCISTQIRPFDQKIQPWEFGHDASKGTCLWLNDLPKLTATSLIAPRLVNGKPRWANQTDSGQNKLGPSETRSADRARTYAGIAKAMAEQWG